MGGHAVETNVKCLDATPFSPSESSLLGTTLCARIGQIGNRIELKAGFVHPTLSVLQDKQGSPVVVRLSFPSLTHSLSSSDPTGYDLCDRQPATAASEVT
jgi:hypothetical protein